MSKHDDDVIETIEYKGYGVQVKYDMNASSPREEGMSMVGKMVCFHRKYDLADKEHDLKTEDFKGWEDMRLYLIREEGALVILPVLMYEHSSVALSTSRTYPFNDRWDAGQVGWIYANEKTIGETFGFKLPLSDEHQERVVKALEIEVEEYGHYLNGDMVGFSVAEKVDDEWEDVDWENGCWGFIGHDYEENGLMEHAKSDIDCHLKELEEQAKKPEYRVLFSKEMVVHADTEEEALTEAMAAFIKFAEGRFDREDLGWLIKGPIQPYATEEQVKDAFK